MPLRDNLAAAGFDDNQVNQIIDAIREAQADGDYSAAELSGLLAGQGYSQEQIRAVRAARQQTAANRPAGGGGGGGGEHQDIPPNGTLIRVRNPEGSDAESLYFVRYRAFGVDVVFEIGDQDRLNELFGNTGFFDRTETMTQREFDNGGYLNYGLIDEQLGTTETIQSQMERGMREFGLEDIPQWMRDDREAMFIAMSGAREGWSSGRIALELSRTAGFRSRYSAYDAIARSTGSDSVLENVAEYERVEGEIRTALRAYRGPDTDTSFDYIGRLMRTGWSSSEVATTLEADRRLRNDPSALDALNNLLIFHGGEALGHDQVLDLMRGAAAPETFGMVNDALRQAALSAEGIQVSEAFAASLGSDEEMGLLSEESVTSAAQNAARNILRFRLELAAGKFGITHEDIIGVAFGEGEASGEIVSRLEQFAREQAAAAQGFGGIEAYTDAQGRLRLPSLSGL